MRTKGFICIAALALALGLIVAGCGGGGDNGDSSSTSASTASTTSVGGTSSGTSSTSSSGEQLTKDEFVGKANAICQDGRQQLSKVQSDLQAQVQADPSKAREIAANLLSQLVPVLRGVVDRIAALNPPDELKGKLEEFHTKATEALDQVEKDPSAARGSGAFADLTQLANDLGLDQCGATGG